MAASIVDESMIRNRLLALSETISHKYLLIAKEKTVTVQGQNLINSTLTK